jgi:ankyrin repeat protein
MIRAFSAFFFDAGADARRSGNSLIEPAIRFSNDGRLLEMLVEAGADINAVDKYGNTACHSLARSHDIGLLPTLVRLGANVAVANKQGETPMSNLLSSYVERKACDIIALLDVGANVTSTTLDGFSVCHFASKLSDLILMESLINKYGANVNRTTEKGETPLMIAVENGNVKMVSMLLAAGAQHDVVRCADGATALHLAIGFSCIDIAKALIDAGANVNALDARGWSPGHWACALGDEKLFDRLIGLGADVNAATATGDTMLHVAANWRANGPIIGRLIAAGADLNAVNQQGQTVFHIAACNLSALTALGGMNAAVLDREDNAGWTPLANAVIATNEECTLAMVAAGATVNRVDRDGLTLLHLYLAHSRNRRFSLRFVRTLVRLGIDVNALDNKRMSAIDIAASSNSKLLTTLIAVGTEFRKFEKVRCWDAETMSLFLASTDDGNKVEEYYLLRRFQAALSTAPADTDSSEVQEARAMLASARLRLVRARGAEICIGLQSLRLDALRLCEILLVACAPASTSTHVPFHELWNVAVKVKHFNFKFKQKANTNN